MMYDMMQWHVGVNGLLFAWRSMGCLKTSSTMSYVGLAVDRIENHYS